MKARGKNKKTNFAYNSTAKIENSIPQSSEQLSIKTYIAHYNTKIQQLQTNVQILQMNHRSCDTTRPRQHLTATRQNGDDENRPSRAESQTDVAQRMRGHDEPARNMWLTKPQTRPQKQLTETRRDGEDHSNPAAQSPAAAQRRRGHGGPAGNTRLTTTDTSTESTNRSPARRRRRGPLEHSSPQPRCSPAQARPRRTCKKHVAH